MVRQEEGKPPSGLLSAPLIKRCYSVGSRGWSERGSGFFQTEVSAAWDCPDRKEGTVKGGEEVHAELSPGPGLRSVPGPFAVIRCPPAISGIAPCSDRWCVTSLHVKAPATAATSFKRLCLHRTTGRATPTQPYPWVLLCPFPSLPVQIETLSSPCLLGGLHVG